MFDELPCWCQNAEHKRELEEKERIIREHQQRIKKKKTSFWILKISDFHIY